MLWCVLKSSSTYKRDFTVGISFTFVVTLTKKKLILSSLFDFFPSSLRLEHDLFAERAAIEKQYAESLEKVAGELRVALRTDPCKFQAHLHVYLRYHKVHILRTMHFSLLQDLELE